MYGLYPWVWSGRLTVYRYFGAYPFVLFSFSVFRFFGVCENFRPTASKSYPNLTYPLSSHWTTSPIALSGLE